jgi:hypothetical protein
MASKRDCRLVGKCNDDKIHTKLQADAYGVWEYNMNSGLEGTLSICLETPSLNTSER